MKAVLSFLTLVGLVLAGCACAVTPDVASTVQAGVVATLTAQPTETPVSTPTGTPVPTLTPHIAATLQAAIAATLTAWPTATPTDTRTEAPTAPPTREPVSALPAAPVPTSVPFTHTLETYQGEGFSFQFPVGARVEQVTPNRMAWQRASPATGEIHVIGPQVWIKPGGAGGGYRGAAYELVIRTYENPERLDAESWAREYILASWREARERNRPWGSLPVTEEGEIDERKVASTVVAGQPAFLVWFFGFDSTQPAYYLSTDRQVIELSFGLYPEANQPLAMVQRDVYALILGTFLLE